jgi:hypothetical protein
MPTLADELKAVQEKKARVREDRASAIKERDEFRGQLEAGEDIDRDSDLFTSARDAARKAGELGDELTDLSSAEADLLVMLGRADEAQAVKDLESGNGPEDRGDRAARASRDTVAQAAARIVEESADVLRLYAASSATTGKRRLGELASREQAAEILRDPQAATLVASDVQPIIPPDRREPRGVPAIRTRFLDLIPIGQTNSNSIETVIEQPTALTANMVLDDGTTRKPEEDLDFVPGDFPVRTVAAWLKIHKNALEDAPRIQGLLQRRLPQKLRKRLELQAIAGTGVAPQLRGLLNTTGIGVVTQAAGPPVQPAVEAILDAITLVILTDYDPNIVGLSPTQWAAIRKMREEANAGQYLFGSPAVAGDTTVWGIPATAAASIANNRAIVGDTDGMELTVRSGIQVLISDADGEDFTHNRVTVLAEGRFALPIEQPGAFARVEFL